MQLVCAADNSCVRLACVAVRAHVHGRRWLYNVGEAFEASFSKLLQSMQLGLVDPALSLVVATPHGMHMPRFATSFFSSVFEKQVGAPPAPARAAPAQHFACGSVRTARRTEGILPLCRSTFVHAPAAHAWMHTRMHAGQGADTMQQAASLAYQFVRHARVHACCTASRLTVST